jgi:hypothetical protein
MPIKFGVKKAKRYRALHEAASGRHARRRPAEQRTNRDQGIDQTPHVGFGVIRRRGDPEPLLPARNGRIVNRLNVNVVILKQEVRSLRHRWASPITSGRI